MKEIDGSSDYMMKSLDAGVVSILDTIPLEVPGFYVQGAKNVVDFGFTKASGGKEQFYYRREEGQGTTAHILERQSLEQPENKQVVLIANNKLIDCKGFQFGLGTIEAQEVVINFVNDIAEALNGK